MYGQYNGQQLFRSMHIYQQLQDTDTITTKLGEYDCWMDFEEQDFRNTLDQTLTPLE